MNLFKNEHPIFHWEGINQDGMHVKGEHQDHDLLSAKVALKSSNIVLLTIHKNTGSLLLKFYNRVRFDDIYSFAKTLSTLTSANMPLTNALEITESNANKPALKSLITHIREHITSGASLLDALKQCQPHFDEIFCSLVNAGEQSGTLDIMLMHITKHYEKKIKLKRNLQKALFYPMSIMIVSLCVTIGLLVFIVPQFANLFNSVGAELPILTQIMINLSDTISNHIVMLSALSAISIIILKIQRKRSQTFSILLDNLYLKTPLFGGILKHSIFSKIFHTLSILLKTGIPFTEALTLTHQLSNNQVYQRAFSKVLEDVNTGCSIHQSLEDTGAFPPCVIQMVSVGEASGTLDDMLENLGDYYEERLNQTTEYLGQFLEPIIMVFLCLIVGTVVVAMYLPIFKLGTVI